MSKLPFRYPDIERVFMSGFANEVGNKTKSLREQFMAPENVLKFTHGITWEAPANELGDKVGTFKRYGSEIELNLADVVNGKLGLIFEHVQAITDEVHLQLERSLFETVHDTTERTGQVVDGRNKSFPEAMFESVEMLNLPIGEDGELSLPTMFVHPSQGEKIGEQFANLPPEFAKKFEELKDRKKNEAQVREQERLDRFEKRQNE